jgi:hypothetical protein
MRFVVLRRGCLPPRSSCQFCMRLHYQQGPCLAMLAASHLHAPLSGRSALVVRVCCQNPVADLAYFLPPQFAADLLSSLALDARGPEGWRASIGLSYGPVTVTALRGLSNSSAQAIGETVAAAEEIAVRVAPWHIGVMSIPEHLAARSMCLEGGRVVRALYDCPCANVAALYASAHGMVPAALRGTMPPTAPLPLLMTMTMTMTTMPLMTRCRTLSTDCVCCQRHSEIDVLGARAARTLTSSLSGHHHSGSDHRATVPAQLLSFPRMQVAVCELTPDAARRHHHVDKTTLDTRGPVEPLLQELGQLREMVDATLSLSPSRTMQVVRRSIPDQLSPEGVSRRRCIGSEAFWQAVSGTDTAQTLDVPCRKSRNPSCVTALMPDPMQKRPAASPMMSRSAKARQAGPTVARPLSSWLMSCWVPSSNYRLWTCQGRSWHVCRQSRRSWKTSTSSSSPGWNTTHFWCAPAAGPAPVHVAAAQANPPGWGLDVIA